MQNLFKRSLAMVLSIMMIITMFSGMTFVTAETLEPFTEWTEGASHLLHIGVATATDADSNWGNYRYFAQEFVPEKNVITGVQLGLILTGGSGLMHIELRKGDANSEAIYTTEVPTYSRGNVNAMYEFGFDQEVAVTPGEVYYVVFYWAARLDGSVAIVIGSDVGAGNATHPLYTWSMSAGGDVSFEVLKVSGSPLNQPTLYLRLPAWADRKATFITNGVRVSVDASREYYPGYLTVNVTEGKKFMLSFNDFFRYIHPADVSDVPVENIPYLAVRLGPTVYAADDTLEEEPVYDIDTTGSFRTWMAYDHYPEESAVPCRGILKLPLKNGEQLTLVDYPSAGQVPGHKVSAWIKTKA